MPNTASKSKSKWETAEDVTISQVNKAGKYIAKYIGANNSAEYNECLSTINKWRAAHAYPMHIIYDHLRHMAQRSYKGAIVAERLKRMTSIISKIRLNPAMKVARMQDMGGCRVILKNIDELKDFVTSLKSSRMRHIFRHEKDYIKEPKKSGYRSIHLIYEYKSERPSKRVYNDKFLIEIQFRTFLQHSWSTALETYAIFTGQDLKRGAGDEKALRFFALTASIIAYKEGCEWAHEPTTTSFGDIVKEAKRIDNEIKVIDFLQAIKVTEEHIKSKQQTYRKYSDNDKKTQKRSRLPLKGYYILELNYKTRRLRYEYIENVSKAQKQYEEKEKVNKHNGFDTVLVKATSWNNIKKAYPNYFSNIETFINLLNDIFMRF